MGSGRTFRQPHRRRRLRGSSLSNDPSVLGLLWFGGCCSAGYNVGTNWTWKFVAGSWTNLSTGVTSLPTGEWDGSMAYDATDQGVLLVSGSTHASWTTTYTSWFFNGTWHPEPNAPVPNTGADSVAPALADDPSDGYVVLVPSWNGTNDSGISFHYSGGAWSAGRNRTGLVETLRPAMVFDGHRNADILLDGAGSSYPYQSPPVSTWAYAASTWTNLSAASVGPANRADMAVAYDAADGYVVGFGGCECPANAGYGGVQSDTWKFSAGNWTALATNASPPARALAGLAYDASDGYLLMFGGQGASSTFNDTWEFTNGGWTRDHTARGAPVVLRRDDDLRRRGQLHRSPDRDVPRRDVDLPRRDVDEPDGARGPHHRRRPGEPGRLRFDGRVRAPVRNGPPSVRLHPLSRTGHLEVPGRELDQHHVARRDVPAGPDDGFGRRLSGRRVRPPLRWLDDLGNGVHATERYLVLHQRHLDGARPDGLARESDRHAGSLRPDPLGGRLLRRLVRHVGLGPARLLARWPLRRHVGLGGRKPHLAGDPVVLGITGHD